MSPYMSANTLYAEELRRYRFDDNMRRADHLRRTVASCGRSLSRLLSRWMAWKTVLAAVSLAALPITYV